MIIRAGFLLVALVSAITVGHINKRHSRKRSSSTEHKNVSFGEEQNEKEKGKFEESDDGPKEKKEQIKTCRSGSVLEMTPNKAEKTECKVQEFLVQEKKWNYVTEINLLKKMVKEKEQRRENLELRLIELYCLNEQQPNIAKLRNQLKDKVAEWDMLRAMMNKLEDDRRELSEEVKQNHLAEKQLESAKLTISELQEKLELGAGQLKGHLKVLKEQVSGLRLEGTCRRGNINKVDKELKAMKEVELKAMEMKRRNTELQLEKRDLVLKMDAAQTRITDLSSMTEHKMVGKIEEEIKRLRCVKDNLIEQVERLLNNRFSILEELVYQRWLNFCLRFEFQDCQSPQPKSRKPNIFRRLNSQSENGSKLALQDPSFDRMTSEISSAGSDEVTNTTINSSSSSSSTKNKKSGIIHNMKRWGRRRRDDSYSNTEIRSLQDKAGLFRRFSMSFVPSRTSVQRNKRDRTTLIPTGNEVPDSNSPDMPPTPRVRRVSFNDSLNSVAYTYDDVPKSELGSPNNGHNVAESFSDFSDMKASSGSSAILQEEEAEMASARAYFAPLNSSRDLSNQNIDNKNIETEAGRRSEIVVHEECLSSGMPNVVPGASKSGHDQMVQFIVAFISILFLLLISHLFTNSIGL